MYNIIIPGELLLFVEVVKPCKNTKSESLSDKVCNSFHAEPQKPQSRGFVAG
jgi:hypothetical protein